MDKQEASTLTKDLKLANEATAQEKLAKIKLKSSNNSTEAKMSRRERRRG